MEPQKNTDWTWVKWDEMVTYPNLFLPFRPFFEAGFNDLNKIKKVAEEQALRTAKLTGN